MGFTNTQIPLEDLPRYNSIAFTDLHKLYPIIVLRLTLTTWGVTVMTTAFLIFWFITWFNHKSAKVISYAIRQHDIVLKSGVFWRKETIQPLKRVQHVELTQGPIDKRYGLAKIKLFSAGTAMSTYVIPGLEYQLGLRIKQFILDYQENLGQQFVSTEMNASDEIIS